MTSEAKFILLDNDRGLQFSLPATRTRVTACGLAVALPAVLAYNLFVRLNRVYLAEMDGFAHDVFALLSTGKTPASVKTPEETTALKQINELQAGEI